MQSTSATFAIVSTLTFIVIIIAEAASRATETFEAFTVEPRDAESSVFTQQNGDNNSTDNNTPHITTQAEETGKEADHEETQHEHEEGESIDTEDGSHHCEELDEHYTHHDSHWGYCGINGPSNWPMLYEECGSNSQSPINIETQKTKLNDLLMEISPLIDRIDEDEVTITNTGHTVSVAYNRTKIRLVDGGFDHTYRVIGVHFHWGSNNSGGSEHRIDGKSFPLEMHVVSYDEDNYNDANEAATAGGDGIAVLSVLIQISEQDNDNFSSIVSHLEEVRKPGSSVRVGYFDLTNLLPSNLRDFYRYQGSLTTPPCYESVVWTVFTTTQSISNAQLSKFRSQYEGISDPSNSKMLLLNWRPVQPVGERIVYRSFPLPDHDLNIKSFSPDSDHKKWIEYDHVHSPNEATKVTWTGQHNRLLICACVFSCAVLKNSIGL